MKKFIVIATQRSGSKFFRLYLNSHPDIRLSGEVFIPHDYQYDGFNHFLAQNPVLSFLKHKKYMRSRFAIHLNKLVFMCIPFSVTRKYLQNFFYNPGHSAPTGRTNTKPVYIPNPHFNEEKARGFKVMYNQFKRVHFLKNWIITNNVSVIHLIRQNLLRVFISLIRLRKNRVAHTIQRIATEPVYVSKDKLLTFIIKVKREREYYKKIFNTVPYMEVFFEDFLTNPDKEKGRIINFLNIEDKKMKMPGLKKISSVDIKNDIVNYDEIATFLKQTQYKSFLYNG